MTINGINIQRVALLVGNRESLFATEQERGIAEQARAIGEKLERDGVLPDVRRKRMLQAIVALANLEPSTGRQTA